MYLIYAFWYKIQLKSNLFNNQIKVLCGIERGDTFLSPAKEPLLLVFF